MNTKLAKKLRTIAFSNTPSSDERAARRWVILEDKKRHRLLRCLDPRATYKMMKYNFKTLPNKKRMRKEIEILSNHVKKNFPKGIVFGDDRTFLGHKLPTIGGENALR